MHEQLQKAFEIHYSILRENGTLARKVQVVPGKEKDDAIISLRKTLEVQGIDLRKINIYKAELSASKLPSAENETVAESESMPPVKNKSQGQGLEKPESKKTEAKRDGPQKQEPAETPNGFNNRVMSFICDVKQNVITNKDGVRTLKLVLEICGTQVNSVQSGMLKYRPQECLKITCEPVQIDALDDKTKKPERQMELDDTTRTKKLEEEKGFAARQEKKKKSNGNAKPENESTQQEQQDKVILPRTALSQGVDSKGNQYFFDRETRQMYAATKAGVISKVDGPPEPLRQIKSGYRGQ